MPDALLQVEALEAGYGEVQVLWGVSLNAGSGQLTAIVGANGAGKTTMLRAMTVDENLELGAFSKRAARNYSQRLDQAFSLFPRLAERRRQIAGTLSGGEQQMLALARGLMSDPEILIIDEMSLGLAPVLVCQLFMTLKTLKQAGLTILLVEQNVHLALAVSDYAYVLAEGRVFTEGLPAVLAAKPEIRRAYLGM